jgi:hypothetical protein
MKLGVVNIYQVSFPSDAQFVSVLAKKFEHSDSSGVMDARTSLMTFQPVHRSSSSSEGGLMQLQGPINIHLQRGANFCRILLAFCHKSWAALSL